MATPPYDVRLSQHAQDLDVDGHLPAEALTTAETDDTMVLAPDGAGGVEFRAEAVGVASHLADATDAHDASAISVADAAGSWTGTDVEAILAEIGAGMRGFDPHGGVGVGSAETVDFATGHHQLILNANLTLAFTGAVSGDSYWTVVDYVGDGTVRTLGYSGSTVQGTVTLDSTLSAVTRVVYSTTDGGANVVAAMAGGGSGSALTVKDEGSSLATAASSIDFVGAGITASGTGAAKTVTLAVSLDNLTDAAVSSAASNQTLIYDGTNFVNSSGIWRPVMDGAGAVITDGATGEAIMALS